MQGSMSGGPNLLSSNDELNKLWKAAKNGDINLVCYCSPKSCHGDTIKTIIEQKL